MDKLANPALLTLLLMLFAYALSRAWASLIDLIYIALKAKPDPWVKWALPALMLIGAVTYVARNSTSFEDVKKNGAQVVVHMFESQIPNVERLGVTGAAGLRIAENAESGRIVFMNAVAAKAPLTFIEPAALAADPVYRRLLAAQPQGAARDRAFGGLGGRTIAVAQPRRPCKVALVLFGSHNGFTNPALISPGHALVRMSEAEAGELAASLGADYLIEVGLYPQITMYEPGNKPGFVIVTHAVRMRDRTGVIVLQARNTVKFSGAVTGAFPTVDANLSPAQRQCMGLAGYAFPTEEQKRELAVVERKLMSQSFEAETKRAAQEVAAIFRS
ncbi:MAG: hypothetical protein AB7M12_08520 [Hyphomonadaceae bacterium]